MCRKSRSSGCQARIRHDFLADRTFYTDAGIAYHDRGATYQATGADGTPLTFATMDLLQAFLAKFGNKPCQQSWTEDSSLSGTVNTIGMSAFAAIQLPVARERFYTTNGKGGLVETAVETRQKPEQRTFDVVSKGAASPIAATFHELGSAGTFIVSPSSWSASCDVGAPRTGSVFN